MQPQPMTVRQQMQTLKPDNIPTDVAQQLQQLQQQAQQAAQDVQAAQDAINIAQSIQPPPAAPSVEQCPQSPARVHFDAAAQAGDNAGELKAVEEAFTDFETLAGELLQHIPDARAMRTRLHIYEERINKKLELSQREEAAKILKQFENSLVKMVNIPVHHFAEAELKTFVEMLKRKGFEVLISSIGGLVSLIVSL